MASGDLDRIESALAEAALDSGLWSRALDMTDIGIFGTLPPLGDVRFPAEHHLRTGGLVGSEAGRDLLAPPGDALFDAIAGLLARPRQSTCVRWRRHAAKKFAQLN